MMVILRTWSHGLFQNSLSSENVCINIFPRTKIFKKYVLRYHYKKKSINILTHFTFLLGTLLSKKDEQQSPLQIIHINLYQDLWLRNNAILPPVHDILYRFIVYVESYKCQINVQYKASQNIEMIPLNKQKLIFKCHSRDNYKYML